MYTFRKSLAIAMKQYFWKHLLPTCAQINSEKAATFSTNDPISSNVIFKKLAGEPLEHPTKNRANILTQNIVTM